MDNPIQQIMKNSLHINERNEKKYKMINQIYKKERNNEQIEIRKMNEDQKQNSKQMTKYSHLKNINK